MVLEKDILEYLKLDKGADSSRFSDAVVKRSRRYQVVDGQLCLKVGTSAYPVPVQETRLTWLQGLHEELGHPTSSGMYTILKEHWRWENMMEDIERVISGCLNCAYGGSEVAEEKSNWVQHRSSWRLFDEISVDLITKLPVTARGMNNLLVITEAVSGWPEAYPIKTKSAEEVGGCLYNYFSRYMVPRRLRSDRGGEFVNDVIQLLSQTYHFEHILSSSRHPQGDGQVERRNRDIIGQLEKTDMEDWDLNLDNVLTGIRVRPTVRTGLSPYEVLFCQPPRLPLDLRFRSNLCDLPNRAELMDKLSLSRFVTSRSAIYRDLWKQVKAKLKGYENLRHSHQARFKPGELVMVRNKARKKGEAKWNGPYVVVKNHAKGVMVRLMNGKLMPYHESDLKKFKFPITESTTGEEFVGNDEPADEAEQEVE
jgi:hypothetical protein